MAGVPPDVVRIEPLSTINVSIHQRIGTLHQSRPNIMLVTLNPVVNAL